VTDCHKCGWRTGRISGNVDARARRSSWKLPVGEFIEERYNGCWLTSNGGLDPASRGQSTSPRQAGGGPKRIPPRCRQHYRQGCGARRATVRSPTSRATWAVSARGISNSGMTLCVSRAEPSNTGSGLASSVTFRNTRSQSVQKRCARISRIFRSVGLSSVDFHQRDAVQE
jgi:hypothetical protein